MWIVAPEQKSFRAAVERFIYTTYGDQFELNLLLPGLVNMFLWLQSGSCFAAILFPRSVEHFSWV